MTRLVTWNVNGALDPGAVGRVLAQLEPDIVALIETPSRLGLRRLARATELRVIARAGTRRVGVAILAGERCRVLSTAVVELPGVEGSPDREAAHAIIGVGPLRLSVVGVQLGLHPEVRMAHAARLERFIATIDLATVLAGDLSEPPGGPAVQRLTGLLDDAFARAGTGSGMTYPTPEPTARHDYVLVAPSLHVETCWVPSEAPIDTASHHRPVVVVLGGPDSSADTVSPDPEPLPQESEDDSDDDADPAETAA